VNNKQSLAKVFVPSEILGKENEEKIGARKEMGNSTRFIQVLSDKDFDSVKHEVHLKSTDVYLEVINNSLCGTCPTGCGRRK